MKLDDIQPQIWEPSSREIAASVAELSLRLLERRYPLHVSGGRFRSLTRFNLRHLIMSRCTYSALKSPLHHKQRPWTFPPPSDGAEALKSAIHKGGASGSPPLGFD
ncbi:hypothetical protein G7Z17_g12621 [Cylindrodendrum hubeiense]|uniref:Uncharacterized protein n=1 Tax=Cylindrodendrum hubeiense TaxID=595255 RepID=A0A9P5GTQ1_9HYPO|nr:hypothetical protein G7Z17_g12621 [Cylindrodendrum hubeiense]